MTVKKQNTMTKFIPLIISMITIAASLGGAWKLIQYRIDQLESKAANSLGIEKVRTMVKDELKPFEEMLEVKLKARESWWLESRDQRRLSRKIIKERVRIIERALYRKGIL